MLGFLDWHKFVNKTSFLVNQSHSIHSNDRLIDFQSTAQKFIPVILCIDTSYNAWHNQAHWLIGTPYLSIIASNAVKSHGECKQEVLNFEDTVALGMIAMDVLFSQCSMSLAKLFGTVLLPKWIGSSRRDREIWSFLIDYELLWNLG